MKILFIIIFSMGAYAKKHPVEIFKIDLETQKHMLGLSMKEGCPVPFDELRLIKFLHYDYNQSVTQGELIVHQKVSEGLKIILKNLFEAQFPFQRVKRVDYYQADDVTSMKANNTSAFNCRPITGKKNEFSLHSYGLAIDINPLVNPYVKGDTVLPAEGVIYKDRTIDAKGVIRENDLIVEEFKKQGWRWGGEWTRLQDYQHFEMSKDILE